MLPARWYTYGCACGFRISMPKFKSVDVFYVHTTPCQCPSPFFWTPVLSVEAMGTLNTQLEETKTFGDQPEGPCAA
jgi:hypothetical protein